jgi:anaerobic magnesium-protoporphyrin IX monomethyl ester cyclase
MTFTCYSRPELLTKQKIKLLRQSGCKKVRIGVETPQPVILKLFLKSSVLSTIKKVIRNCKLGNIKTHTSFQIGFPNDTFESINFTKEYAIRINPDYAYFYFFIPYPGTSIFNYFEKYLTTDDLTQFWLFNPIIKVKKLSKQQLLFALYKCYEDFYISKGYIIPRFISLDKLNQITPKNVLKLVYYLQKIIYPPNEYVRW